MTSTLLTGTPEIPVPISQSSTIGINKTLMKIKKNMCAMI